MKKENESQDNMICQISNLIKVLGKINENLEYLHGSIENLSAKTDGLGYEMHKIKNILHDIK